MTSRRVRKHLAEIRAALVEDAAASESMRAFLDPLGALVVCASVAYLLRDLQPLTALALFHVAFIYAGTRLAWMSMGYAERGAFVAVIAASVINAVMGYNGLKPAVCCFGVAYLGTLTYLAIQAVAARYGRESLDVLAAATIGAALVACGVAFLAWSVNAAAVTVLTAVVLIWQWSLDVGPRLASIRNRGAT